MKTKMKTETIPDNVYAYLFDQYVDGNNERTRFGLACINSEYGVSSSSFLDANYDDAIADGKDYFNECDHERQIVLLTSYVEHTEWLLEIRKHDVRAVKKLLSKKGKLK